MSPIERIARFLDLKAREWLEESHSDLIENGATPIEASFLLALSAALKADDYFRLQLRQADDRNQCGVEPQKKVENYIVDYVISVLNERSGRRHFLAVECDGHDFHERTKDQAKKDRSRDRRLQELGFAIYRFTGSEIHNDPMKCAESVMEWLYTSSWKKL